MVNISDLHNASYDVLILGGGVAGLSASIYTTRSGLKTLIVEGELVSNTEVPGGALMLTESIENFPGYSGSGEGLIEILRKQSEEFGSDKVEALTTTLNVDVNDDGEASICISEFGSDPVTVFGKTVIIATGAVSKKLGVPGEEEFFGRGVSTCATCDGWAYEGKNVAVVGGGDTAIEDALYLSRNVNHVDVLVRSHEFRTNSPESRLLVTQPNVDIHWNTSVSKVNSDEEGKRVASVSLISEGKKFDKDIDGIFVAVGRNPNTAFLEGTKVRLDNYGYVITDHEHRVEVNTNTYAPNIFAVGDVADAKYVQAITASGDAVKAAIAAYEYIVRGA